MKLWFVLLACFATINISAAYSSQESPPNIIVILTDDQGYADLSCQQVEVDVRTPHIDSLAENGIRMTAAYVTAPQCSPSRAAIITGRYQQRFGLTEISQCPLPLEEVTLAERLKTVGYRTGMVGKWHLSPNALSVRWAKKNLSGKSVNRVGRVNIPMEKVVEYHPHAQGFDEYYAGEVQQYFTNYPQTGEELLADGKWLRDRGYRIDLQTQAAVSFIDRNAKKPFFLYLNYFGPHVPLQATPTYLERFSGEMKERRRYGLAMISAIDDGVGKILECLKRYQIEENTLIIFTSDNGAPLNLTKNDDPIGQGGPIWDGSLNSPWIGEKGMLSEGGLRVPFILQYKKLLPGGKVYHQPVSSLDIVPTALALAGVRQSQDLDGVNLLPFLTGTETSSPHKMLFWSFWNQLAVRSVRWKFLQVGPDQEYLFDMNSEMHEKQNVAMEHPDVVEKFKGELEVWASKVNVRIDQRQPIQGPEARWYQFYFGE